MPNSVLIQFCISVFSCEERSLAARRRVRWHVNTHACTSTNRSWRISLCQLSSLYRTGHNRRTSGPRYRYLSPKVLHQNSSEAVSKLLFKLCSLLSIFLSLLGGFVLAKASSSLQTPPSPERPAFSDFGGKTEEAGAATCRCRVSWPASSAVRRCRQTGIQNKRGHVGPPYSAGEQHIAAN